MPLKYGSELAEHKAVRTTGGLFDLSHMGEIDLIGPQAARALDYAVVSDLSGLAVGRAKYTMICNDSGGIIDDLIIYRLDDQHYMVVANASNAARVLDELRLRAAGFDVEVRDTRNDWSLLAIQGPRSGAVLGPLTDVDLDALRYYRITAGEVAGCPVRLARTGYTGEDGFEVFCDPRYATTIWQALLQAGADDEVIACGLACRDSLRLEAGMPLYGHELDETLTPFEAGLGRLVALSKSADFVGREALAERAEHPVAQVRVGLRCEGRRSPRAGYPVLDADGQQVGRVTSGAPSPTLGYPIAMAYLDVTHAQVGTAVSVDVRGSRVATQVVTLPFYHRQP
jgi:aminomethyltransferase